MSDSAHDVVDIPSLEELKAMVVPRRCAVSPAASTGVPDASPSSPDLLPSAAAGVKLSPLADALLRHAAQPHHRHWSLEQHWHELKIASGSVKARILNELRAAGFIRAEAKSREKHLHLYRAAYDFLGIEPPTGEGVGGATHKNVAAKIRKMLNGRGYTVYIEQEIGPARKRVDLVAYGRKVLGVEIGLTDPRQELKNLRDDLASGVLDGLLFVTTEPPILRKVKALASADPLVAPHLGSIKFVCLTGDLEP